MRLSGLVMDPFGVAGDPAMPDLARALDPVLAGRALRGIPRLGPFRGALHVQEIRVVRYKPGRRCLVEYVVALQRPGRPPETTILLGKARRHRTGSVAFGLADALWEAGFDAACRDGIAIPEPVGYSASLHMWFQRKVAGVPATDLLAKPGGETLAGRIAVAAHKVHRTGVRPRRRHTMRDELEGLCGRLHLVTEARPGWARRVDRVRRAAIRIAAATPDPASCGIHRDFYGDQILIDGPRTWLIDFDMYCEGDPALDIGNFIGHVQEYSLRVLGDPSALSHVERALEDRFVELAGEQARGAIHSYAKLTLARHIYLSTLFVERRAFTEALLDLCEAWPRDVADATR